MLAHPKYIFFILMMVTPSLLCKSVRNISPSLYAHKSPHFVDCNFDYNKGLPARIIDIPKDLDATLNKQRSWRVDANRESGAWQSTTLDRVVPRVDACAPQKLYLRF